MPKKTYEPKPLDTSHIRQTRELQKLIEELARNTHDVWASQRISEGWTYGPKRDDVNKQHPDLVPYNKLTEKEKAYDRKTAEEVIKALLAMGYRIEKP
ncbi:MAG TPA: RyR domain-containing protein [Candidatus Dormibacteraeota bacterium]|nr:RyR domain-containing protein [Candidatus Dormibacteraeota bacterium]